MLDYKEGDYKKDLSDVVETVISAKNGIHVNSKEGSIILTGINVNSDSDILLDGSKNVSIEAQSFIRNNKSNSYDSYVWGIGGADSTNKNTKNTLNARSNINAKGSLFISGGEQIRILGSTVKGGADSSVITRKDSITIDNAENVTEQDINKYNRTFILKGSNSNENISNTEVVSSELASDTNLKLETPDKVVLKGSFINVAKTLDIKALGGVELLKAENTSSRTVNGVKVEVGINGKADDEAGEASVGINIKGTKEDKNDNSSTVVKSGISAGNNLVINTGGTLLVNGADLSGNNIFITAKDVKNLAAYDKTLGDNYLKVADGGYTFYVGVERIGHNYKAGYNANNEELNKQTAVVNTFNADNNISFNIANKLFDEASKVTAGGKLLVTADQIDQVAVYNSNIVNTSSEGGSASFGVTLNPDLKTFYDDQVGAVRNGVLPTSVETHLIDPDLGINAAADYDSRDTEKTIKTAVTGSFQGSEVELNGRQVDLQASDLEATDGNVVVNAEEYNHTAVHDNETTSELAEGGSGSARVATQYKDVRLSAEGEYHWVEKSTEAKTAVTGQVNAKNGNVVFNTGKGHQEGVDISATGSVIGTAGENFTFDTAQSTTESHVRVFNAGGEISGMVGIPSPKSATGAAKGSASATTKTASKKSVVDRAKDVYETKNKIEGKDDEIKSKFKGFGIAGNYEDDITLDRSTTHKVGSITASKDIQFTSKGGDIVLKATKVDAEGKAKFVAENGITSVKSVQNTEYSNESNHKIAAELGIKRDKSTSWINGKSDEYREVTEKQKTEKDYKLTAEQEKKFNKEDQKKKYEKKKGFLNIGVDVEWNDVESGSSTAVVADITGQNGITIASGQGKTLVEGASLTTKSDSKVVLHGSKGVDFQAATSSSFIKESINDVGLGVEKQTNVKSKVATTIEASEDDGTAVKYSKKYANYKLKKALRRKNNSIGGGLNVEFSRGDYETSVQQAGSIKGGAVEISANNSDVELTGTDVQAESFKVRAKNFNHEATTSTDKGNGWNAKLSLNPLDATLIDDRISGRDSAEKAKKAGVNHKNRVGGGYDNRDMVTRQGGTVLVNNIDIQVDNNARFVGTNLSAKQGQVVAGNDIQLDKATSTHNQYKVQADVGGSLGGKAAVEYKDIDRVKHQGTTLDIAQGNVKAGNNLDLTASRITGNANVEVGNNLTVTSLKDKDISTEVSGSVEVKRPSGTITFKDAAEKNLPVLSTIRQIKDALKYQADIKADVKTSNTNAVEQAAGISANQVKVGGDVMLTGAKVEAHATEVQGAVTTSSVTGNVDKSEGSGSVSLGLSSIIDRITTAVKSVQNGESVEGSLKKATEVKSPVTYKTEKKQQHLESAVVTKRQ